MVAGDRRRPAASSSNSVMTPPRARRRAASIAEESGAEDIALDAQSESRFASVALAAGVLTGPSVLPQRDSEARAGRATRATVELVRGGSELQVRAARGRLLVWWRSSGLHVRSRCRPRQQRRE